MDIGTAIVTVGLGYLLCPFVVVVLVVGFIVALEWRR